MVTKRLSTGVMIYGFGVLDFLLRGCQCGFALGGQRGFQFLQSQRRFRVHSHSPATAENLGRDDEGRVVCMGSFNRQQMPHKNGRALTKIPGIDSPSIEVKVDFTDVLPPPCNTSDDSRPMSCEVYTRSAISRAKAGWG